MTDFMNMSEKVREQAEDFLQAEGIDPVTPIPEIDEQLTIADMVAAPFQNFRITAALAILRTVEALSTCRLIWLFDPTKKETIERYAALAYRLRMYQDAMHSEKLRTRYKKHHARKPRQHGSDREGTAAWFVSHFTTDQMPLNKLLKQIAEFQKDAPVVLKGIRVELRNANGETLSGSKITGSCSVRFKIGDRPKSLNVKTLRAVLN